MYINNQGRRLNEFEGEIMASSKEYFKYILEQLSELEEISYRAMMGEFLIYYRGKLVGGIYDDRLLVKPIKSAIAYMPAACSRILFSAFPSYQYV